MKEVKCLKCSNCKVRKNGFALIKGQKKQRFFCQSCNRNFTIPGKRKYSLRTKFRAITMYLNGVGIRKIGIILNIDNPLILYWIKVLSKKMQEIVTELMQENANNKDEIPVLEIDEMCVSIKKKGINCGYGLLWTETETKLLVLK